MLRRSLHFLFLFALVLAACDCGDDPGGADDSGIVDDASTLPDGGEDRVACSEDGSCEGGDICGNNALCCPMSELCGGSCCVSGEACEGALCRLDCGNERSRCADEDGNERCCAEGELCVSGVCFLPSPEPCRDFVECPAGQYCEFAGSEDGSGVCLPQAGGEMCAIPPEGSDVEPVLAWRWPPRQNPNEPWSAPVGIAEPDHVHVMMAPMVANLTDDNGNGKIDEGDIPDVVFNTFSRHTQNAPYSRNGILRIVSGDDGRTIHSFTGQDERVVGGAQVAIADLDGDGFPEIVSCSSKRNGASYLAKGPLIAFTSKPIAADPSVRQWEVLWTADDADGRADCGQAGPAIADLDGDGKPEVFVRYTVVSGQTGAILAHEPCGFFGTSGLDDHNPCDYTTAADLDLDGELEIVGGNVAFRYRPEVEPEPGAINFGLSALWDFRDCQHASADPNFPPNADANCRRDGYPAVGDFDLDGWPEVAVIESGRVRLGLSTHDSDHFLVVRNGRTGEILAPAVDLNLLGPPSSADHGTTCRYLRGDEEVTAAEYDEDPEGIEKICLIGGGGPPTIANFDPDDPEPEIAVAGAYNYAVFDVDLKAANPENRVTKLWAKRTFDHSSRKTGSSVFDFDGDGAPEVIYNDQEWLRIYDGKTGDTVFCQCNFSATLWEYPIVVDVDNDGQSEIVVATNAYTTSFYSVPPVPDIWLCKHSPEADDCTDRVLNIPPGWREMDPPPPLGPPNNAAAAQTAPSGISVYKGPGEGWIGTRRIWNQHTYHVTNITELGRVPARETTNWTQNSLNNFRLNVQPGATYQPDVRLRNASVQVGTCAAPMTIYVEIHNAGWAAAPVNFPVSFYELDGEPATLLGTVLTDRPLFPGETRLVEFRVNASLADQRQFRVRANDPGDEAVGAILECREDGKSLDVSAACFNLGPG